MVLTLMTFGGEGSPDLCPWGKESMLIIYTSCCASGSTAWNLNVASFFFVCFFFFIDNCFVTCELGIFHRGFEEHDRSDWQLRPTQIISRWTPGRQQLPGGARWHRALADILTTFVWGSRVHASRLRGWSAWNKNTILLRAWTLAPGPYAKHYTATQEHHMILNRGR